MARVQSRKSGARRGEPAPRPKAQNSRSLLLVGGIAAVVLLVLVAALMGGGRGGPAVDLEGIAQEGTVLGDPAAPLLIREYADYSCPTCKNAARDLFPPIVQDFVRDGRARIEVIPVGVINEPASSYAAMAALCAAEQNQFWTFQDKLYEMQGVRAFEPTTLAGMTEGLDLDAAAFQSCVATNKYQRQVEANNAEFRTIGAQGTPTFIVGGQAFSGNPPYDQVRSIIEGQLAEQ